MGYRVRTSLQAEQDLERIYGFIAAEMLGSAATWFNGLCAAIETLNEMPQRFPLIREDPMTRHLLYGNKPHIYRVLYRIDESASVVNILSVRHGARSSYKARKNR